MSFSTSAARNEQGEFLESYHAYLRRQRLSVLTSLTLFLFITIQTFTLGVGLFRVSQPSLVEAYGGSTTLNPTWDRTSNKSVNYIDDGGGGCVIGTITYTCDSLTATTLRYGFTDNTSGGTVCPASQITNNSGLKFDLTSVPAGVTVTKVELIANVTTTTTETININHATTDSPDGLSCNNGALFIAALGTNYANVSNWNTTGSKTVDLGSTAVSDVQSRLAGSKLFALALSITNPANPPGAVNSVDNASNKPQLVVTYTLPPQAPTATNHGAITTTSVVWTWTDNATVETRYDVHDASHAPVTGCTNLAANTQTCTETGLSANTQYTRHPNVTDANGNTDGPSASAYTAIQTPTGISFSGVTANAITATATGSLSNLSSGSSGLWFQESATATNSGWTQTNTWAKSGLLPNTLYTFQAKARNGDAVETSLTSGVTKYTLAELTTFTPTQSTSTWYTSPTFSFSDDGNFGPGSKQYDRYIFDQQPTHVFNGTESTLSTDNSLCPGGTCTTIGPDLDVTATSEGNNWYFHFITYNAEDVASGSGETYGPLFYDAANPTAPATVNDGTGADATYTTSTTTLSANWTAATDSGSGIQKYQYAIGTTAGGTQVLAYTDNVTTSVTKNGLTLSNGTTYYISVRAVDNTDRTGSSTTSNGITVNTSLPNVTDNQTGDTTPRRSAGTTYDVDFSKSSTGPNLDYAQYSVYSGPNKTGTLLKNWTDIFTADTASYTTDWAVDFSSLQEGTNYVSVNVVALDDLSNELDDVFTILKDTAGPVISAVSASTTASGATVTWTTNEAATSQVAYGPTSSYGTSTTLSSALTTSHSVTITGLSSGTTYHYSALSNDAAGNASASSDATFITGSSAPVPTPTPTPTPSSVTTPTITNLGQGSVIADTKPIIAGIGPVNAAIFVLVDRQLVRTVLVDSSGHYHVTLLNNLTLGNHQFVVRARTSTGAVSDESEPITVTIVRSSPKPTILKKLFTDGSQPTVTYYAVAPAHSTIHVLFDGSMFKTIHAESATSAYGFILKLNIPTNLPAINHQFSLFTVDSFGRPSSQVGVLIFNLQGAINQPVVHYNQAIHYVVQPGDSLWSIAQQFTGDGRNWTKLVSANTAAHPSIANAPHTIHVGWTLTIPTNP